MLPQLILLVFHIKETTILPAIFYSVFTLCIVLHDSYLKESSCYVAKWEIKCWSCFCIIKMPSECHDHTETRLISAELLRLAQNKNASKLPPNREKWKMLLQPL